MIVVAELKKPCSDKARADFIVENNHHKGYQIKETETKIQALDYDNSEKFENAKKDKLQELSQKSSAFEKTENKEMYLISSLGYKVNADPKALRNVNVLISQKVTQFKVYDNTLKPVTVDELKIIKSEIEQNALNLYQQKWTFEDLINKAETKEELDAIEIKFTMSDFSGGNANE